jgi:hypothetical protein
MNDTELNAGVREALERTDVMALSTIDEDDGPWTSLVQYQRDSKLKLYFASMPEARHVRNIQRDARVAVAIYSVPGPPGGNPGLHDDWQRFKIEPIEAWRFDSRTGRQRHQVDLSDLTSPRKADDKPHKSIAVPGSWWPG